MAKTCFNKNAGEFEISWPGSVARHDLVYKAPPADPLQYGLPMGNGDIGALLWCDDRRLYIALNKCDLWDDASFGVFHNWRREEEEFSTTLRHGCRIVIDFGMPVFDTFYLDDFNARLRLKDGCAELKLTGPFGNLWLEAFVTFEGSVLCVRGGTDFTEDTGMEITLERYGTRTFSHWYVFYRRDISLGLTGTEARVEGDCMLLSHRLTTGEFWCALRPEGEGLRLARRTSHMASARAQICPKEFAFYATVTSPFDGEAGADGAKAALAEASKKGFDGLLAKNETSWKVFWSKSFVETDDDYLDNMWHLTMYYSCAGQRGRYPGRFINSLWNWNRDVQPWNFYFHWNQQEVYWPLNAAGHHELCESYLNYRFDGMEHSRADAERLFGIRDGLFVSDVGERRGYNSDSEAHNHTPVCEVALDFWRQYLYTGDRDFLVEKALPYMRGAARFFKKMFKKEADGKYHAVSGLAYEGWTLLYDPITELAMAKVLFDAVLKALVAAGVQDEDADIYRDILENIAPIQLLPADPRMIRDNGDGTGTVLLGWFKGRKVDGSSVLALGKLPEDNQDDKLKAYLGQYIPQYFPNEGQAQGNPHISGPDVVRIMMTERYIPTTVAPEMVMEIGAHPQANVAPVYPMCMIGLKDRGTALYDAAVATALVSREGQMMGWDPMPIVLARLGLSEELDKFLCDYPSTWQFYNNGFSHYGPYSEMLAAAVAPFRRNEVCDVENDKDVFWAETFPFRHMGLEPLGVFAAAMNERLLQSHEGIIRIAPAYGKHSGRFKLHAIGGFEVMCEIAEGVPTLAAVRSLRGERLVLKNPWNEAWCAGVRYAGPVIEMETEPGGVYLFTPERDADYEFEPENPLPNEKFKMRPDRKAMLGLDRAF